MGDIQVNFQTCEAATVEGVSIAYRSLSDKRHSEVPMVERDGNTKINSEWVSGDTAPWRHLELYANARSRLC